MTFLRKILIQNQQLWDNVHNCCYVYMLCLSKCFCFVVSSGQVLCYSGQF